MLTAQRVPDLSAAPELMEMPSPRAFVPGLPQSVDDIVMRALSDVEARFQRRRGDGGGDPRGVDRGDRNFVGDPAGRARDGAREHVADARARLARGERVAGGVDLRSSTRSPRGLGLEAWTRPPHHPFRGGRCPRASATGPAAAAATVATALPGSMVPTPARGGRSRRACWSAWWSAAAVVWIGSPHGSGIVHAEIARAALGEERSLQPPTKEPVRHPPEPSTDRAKPEQLCALVRPSSSVSAAP
jgi:hypothetical protein